MINLLIDKSEYLALTLNIAITLACLFRGDWAKAVYWLGATIVVIGVLNLGKT